MSEKEEESKRRAGREKEESKRRGLGSWVEQARDLLVDKKVAMVEDTSQWNKEVYSACWGEGAEDCLPDFSTEDKWFAEKVNGLTVDAKSNKLAFVSFLKKVLASTARRDGYDGEGYTELVHVHRQGLQETQAVHLGGDSAHDQGELSHPALCAGGQAQPGSYPVLHQEEAKKRLQAKRLLWRCQRHPRPWDENGDDLDWEEYVPCQADYCTQPLPRGGTARTSARDGRRR
eukprot:g78794.t1